MKKNVDGVEIEMTSEEVKERQAEEKANLEGTLVKRMAKLRNERNILLAQTDWMGSSDFTMSNDWKTYRQALRDITKTEPVDMALSNITFPTKPS
tara:strand:- start:187 stop:471 length:285 start_codon:yes stop_codon:yes gene_type:complete